MSTEVAHSSIQKGQILLITRARTSKGLLNVLSLVTARDGAHVVLKPLTHYNERPGVYEVSEFGFTAPPRDFVAAAIGEEALLEIEAEYPAGSQEEASPSA